MSKFFTVKLVERFESQAVVRADSAQEAESIAKNDPYNDKVYSMTDGEHMGSDVVESRESTAEEIIDATTLNPYSDCCEGGECSLCSFDD